MKEEKVKELISEKYDQLDEKEIDEKYNQFLLTGGIDQLIEHLLDVESKNILHLS